MTVNVKKRIEICKKIQYLLMEDGVFIPPQVGPTRFEVIQDDVKDTIPCRVLRGFNCVRPGWASRG